MSADAGDSLSRFVVEGAAVRGENRRRRRSEAHARTAHRGAHDHEARQRIARVAAHFARSVYRVIGNAELRSNAAPASMPTFAIAAALFARS